MSRSLLSVADVSKQEIEMLFEKAASIKRLVKAHVTTDEELKGLHGKIVGMLFEKPSTRTRTSFEAAVLRLGGQAIYLPSTELQLSRGEPIVDTARILGDYLDCIVARVYAHDSVTELATHSGVPVINALSDLEHPTQIVSDLFTIKETKSHLEGLKLAFIGDGNNVCNSLLLGTAIVGMNMSVACPSGYEPNKKIMEKAQELATKTGAKLNVLRKPEDAVKDADVLYTDVWVSMGEEKERQNRIRKFRGYQINHELVTKAAKDAIVMHCLPAHRGLEITDLVIEDRESAVWRQAENKLYSAATILDFCCR
jgi:ornithine carbamoyltransferase